MNRKQIKELDVLWSKKIRKTNYCEWCSKQGTQAHHIFPRSRRNTRWDLENGVELCYRCHIILIPHDPLSYVRWLTELKGTKWLEKLERKSNKIVKYQDFEQVKSLLDLSLLE